MTPELPRAPSSAARATEATISSRPISSIVRPSDAPASRSSSCEDGPQGEHHVVAGVAVGDREDVEVVDLLAAGLERGQAGLDQRAEADDAGIETPGVVARRRQPPRQWLRCTIGRRPT